LLDLGDEQAGAEGMHCPGGQEHDVAGARLEMVQAQVACAACDFTREARAVEAAFETSIDQTPRLGGQNHPGFGLAEVWRRKPSGLFVVGMDLDGKHLLRVKQFEEERKSRLRMMTAEELSPMIADEFGKCDAGQRTGDNTALVLTVVNDLPTFGIVVAFTDRFTQHRTQSAAAPDVAAKDGLEAERVHAGQR
jgi:hypothetical protein